VSGRPVIFWQVNNCIITEGLIVSCWLAVFFLPGTTILVVVVKHAYPASTSRPVSVGCIESCEMRQAGKRTLRGKIWVSYTLIARTNRRAKRPNPPISRPAKVYEKTSNLITT